MFWLFNVAWRVRAGPTGAVDVQPLPTPGPAWFSVGFSQVDSFASLGRQLGAAGNGPGAESLWLVTTDPAVAALRLVGTRRG